MSAEFFLDTNILVYTFDTRQTDKQATARQLVERALSSGTGIISSQVVQEFLNVATRKFAVPLSASDAQRYLRSVLTPLCHVFASMDLYERALTIAEQRRFSFYDALIVGAALNAQCRVLYSEDLQHEQRINGLRIINPFI